VARRSCAVDVAHSPAATLEALVRIAQDLVETDPETPVIGLGLGLPTPMRHGQGVQLSPQLYPSWRGIDVAATLHSALGLWIEADNDANLGALAEHWWGAGRGVDDLAYIKVATGVGAGILIQGEIYRGAIGIAGEIGHTAIDPNGPRCRCGLYGCLEAMVGTSYLLDRYAADTFPEPAPDLTVQHLIDAAHGSDRVAAEKVREAGRYLGIAVANLLNLVNPARVILGGRLTETGELLTRSIEETVRERSLWTSVADAEVCVSPLGDEAIALGGATLILRSVLAHPELHLFSPDEPLHARRGATAESQPSP
jgi:predicted NBD/HSP70 family sugar kinase